MDNLTHSLVGALLGQAGLKTKTGLAMPALIIGANLPDVDAACFFWLEGQEHLGFRRGITHGPPALVLLPLILAGLLWGYDRWQAKRGKRPEGRLPVHFGWLYALSFIGCLTHPALDWLNVYGIRLLEPFSSQWFYGDTLFIIDVWLWALMGFATWFSLRREGKGENWIKPARVAIAVSLAYIGLNGAITVHAEEQGNKLVQHAYEIEPTMVVASPPPIKFWEREILFRRDATAEEGGGALYGKGMFDVFSGPVFFTRVGRMGESKNITLQSPKGSYGWQVLSTNFGDVERAARLVAKDDPEVAAFLFWSRMPVFVEGNCYRAPIIYDQRFSDPRAIGRFTVALPDVKCEEFPTD
uniref:metal-dependent hydrolase n=1 Tax=uncultured Altererythrobacter sp. TaxID=500840 RepID=UPI00262EFEFC|nr:metal-dependent hydrolase [uncultured Altererythrobacter sp.]